MRDPMIDYRDIWRDDADSMVSTMINNIIADMAAGYKGIGPSIVAQLNQLHKYADTKLFYDQMLDRWSDNGEDERVQQWCYNDLLTRGIITG